MKKFLPFILIAIILLCSCENTEDISGTSKNESEMGDISTSSDELTQESESENIIDYAVLNFASWLFFRDEPFTRSAMEHAETTVRTDDPVETAYNYFTDYNTGKFELTEADGLQSYVPDIYVPFNKAFEDVIPDNKLTVEGVYFLADVFNHGDDFNHYPEDNSQMYYGYFFSFEKDREPFCWVECSFENSPNSSLFSDAVKYDEFKIAPYSNDDLVKSTIRNSSVYGYYSQGRLQEIYLEVNGWHYTITGYGLYETIPLKPFCDKQVISQLIDNLREVRANETVSYR